MLQLPYDNDPQTLGDWWNAVGQIGSTALGIGVGFLTQPHGGQGGGQNDCHTHSVECLDALIAQYNAQMQQAAGNTAAQIAVVQSTLAILNDPNVFTQSGGDQYLVNTRNQLQQRLASLQSGTPPAGTTQPPVIDPATGQPVPQPAQTGTSTQTLLLVGGGALLLMMLLKN
jgi:hypothetical protein